MAHWPSGWPSVSWRSQRCARPPTTPVTNAPEGAPVAVVVGAAVLMFARPALSFCSQIGAPSLGPPVGQRRSECGPCEPRHRAPSGPLGQQQQRGRETMPEARRPCALRAGPRGGGSAERTDTSLHSAACRPRSRTRDARGPHVGPRQLPPCAFGPTFSAPLATWRHVAPPDAAARPPSQVGGPVGRLWADAKALPAACGWKWAACVRGGLCSGLC